MTVQEPDDHDGAVLQLSGVSTTDEGSKAVEVITIISDSESESDKAGKVRTGSADAQQNMASEVAQMLHQRPSQSYSVAPTAGRRVDLHGKSPDPRPVKQPRTE